MVWIQTVNPVDNIKHSYGWVRWRYYVNSTAGNPNVPANLGTGEYINFRPVDAGTGQPQLPVFLDAAADNHRGSLSKRSHYCLVWVHFDLPGR